MRWAIIFLCALVLVYGASPYVAFWRFNEALRANDANSLRSRVDFMSVRVSLKQQLRAKFFPSPQPEAPEDALAGLVSRLGPDLIDQLVDSLVTPEGLAALIADPTFAREAGERKDPGMLARLPKTPRNIDWSQVKHAFFTGPREFLVDLNGTKLRFRFVGFRWRLKTVELALDELKL